MQNKYKFWKWLIVVIFTVLPLVIVLLPTAILRIILVYSAECIEWLDDQIHDFLLPYFHKLTKWSENEKSKSETNNN